MSFQAGANYFLLADFIVYFAEKYKQILTKYKNRATIKMEIKIRFLALVTLFVILLSAYMTNVSAASSGICGDNLN